MTGRQKVVYTLCLIFRYSIARSSDPERQFMIEADGTLRVRRHLDRETKDKHIVLVHAIDEGKAGVMSSCSLVTVLELCHMNLLIRYMLRPSRSM